MVSFFFAYGAGMIATIVFTATVTQIINVGMTAVVIFACLTLTRFSEKGFPHAD